MPDKTVRFFLSMVLVGVLAILATTDALADEGFWLRFSVWFTVSSLAGAVLRMIWVDQ